MTLSIALALAAIFVGAILVVGFFCAIAMAAVMVEEWSYNRQARARQVAK